MKQHDVVLLNSPFVDGSASKVRPALVVQSDELNATRRDTIVAIITSRIQQDKTSVHVDPAESGLRGTGLLKNSMIRLERLYTVPQSRVLRKLGYLPARLQDEVRNAIRHVFTV